MPTTSTGTVYPDWRSKKGNGFVSNVYVSSNADGITGADVVDLGGLSLCGMVISTLSSDANYSFRGGPTTALLQTLANSTGDVITKGSTVAGATPGKTLLFDPAPFMGVRFLQVFVGTSAAPLAGQSTVGSIGLLCAPAGRILI